MPASTIQTRFFWKRDSWFQCLRKLFLLPLAAPDAVSPLLMPIAMCSFLRSIIVDQCILPSAGSFSNIEHHKTSWAQLRLIIYHSSFPVFCAALLSITIKFSSFLLPIFLKHNRFGSPSTPERPLHCFERGGLAKQLNKQLTILHFAQQNLSHITA